MAIVLSNWESLQIVEEEIIQEEEPLEENEEDDLGDEDEDTIEDEDEFSIEDWKSDNFQIELSEPERLIIQESPKAEIKSVDLFGTVEIEFHRRIEVQANLLTSKKKRYLQQTSDIEGNQDSFTDLELLNKGQT